MFGMTFSGLVVTLNVGVKIMSHRTHESLIREAQNQSKTIALIYSPIELHEYIVEIISKDSDKFILKGKELAHFNSIDKALLQATNNGAVEFFLCVDNTYDECGAECSAERFDYMPIHSKYTRSSH